MNKFIKVCLAVAGVLVAFGLVFFVIGAIFGGLKQSIKIGKEGGYCFSPQTYGSIWLSLDDNMEDFAEENELIDYREEDLGTDEEIGEVLIELGAGELYVEEYDGKNFKVEAENVSDLECYSKEGILYIEGLQDAYNGIRRRVVTVYIPKSAELDNLDLNLGAGASRIDDIEADEIEIRVGAGELKGSNIYAKAANVSVGAGNIELRDSDLGEGDFEVGMGQIVYTGALTKDVNVECSMGSISMLLDGEKEDFNYKINCEMGSVVVEHSQYAGFSAEKRIDNGANSDMELECAMGSIEVKYNK